MSDAPTMGPNECFSVPRRPAPPGAAEVWTRYADAVENLLAAAEHAKRLAAERLAGKENSRSWERLQPLRRFLLDRLLGKFPRLRHDVARMQKVFLREGLLGVCRRLVDRSVGDPVYEAWLERHGSTAAEQEQVRAACAALPNDKQPLISVLMPVYNPRAEWLEAALASVRAQWYPRWELRVVDDASTAPHVKEILKRAAAEEPRIKPLFRKTNGHISRASQDALEAAEGDLSPSSTTTTL